jgi:hypothetical protein
MSDPNEQARLAFQSNLDSLHDGETLELSPREFPGPIVIRRPIILDGQRATVWSLKGPVISIESDGVVLKNLRVEVTSDAQASRPEEECAIMVQPGRGLLLENVEVRGSVIGLPEEEGEWRYPYSLQLGRLAHGGEHDFLLRMAVPVACRLKSNISGLDVSPHSLKAGVNEVKLHVERLPQDTLLSGVITLSTAFLVRHITATAQIISAQAGQAQPVQGSGQVVWQAPDWDALSQAPPPAPPPSEPIPVMPPTIPVTQVAVPPVYPPEVKTIPVQQPPAVPPPPSMPVSNTQPYQQPAPQQPQQPQQPPPQIPQPSVPVVNVQPQPSQPLTQPAAAPPQSQPVVTPPPPAQQQQQPPPATPSQSSSSRFRRIQNSNPSQLFSPPINQGGTDAQDNSQPGAKPAADAGNPLQSPVFSEPASKPEPPPTPVSPPVSSGSSVPTSTPASSTPQPGSTAPPAPPDPGKAPDSPRVRSIPVSGLFGQTSMPASGLFGKPPMPAKEESKPAEPAQDSSSTSAPANEPPKKKIVRSKTLSSLFNGDEKPEGGKE